MYYLLIFILLTWLSGGAMAEVLIVPTQHETIQEGIDAASDSGDVVLVLPGEYQENIDFDGKAVTVLGVGGASVTTIDGGGEGSCVSFTSGETMSSILSGFTIIGGDAGGNGHGGAVHVERSMPLIAMNVIIGNTAGRGGGAVSATNLSAPVLYRNLFLRNISAGQGGAVYLSGSAGIMLNNTFVGNEADDEGAALYANIGIGIQFVNNIVVHNVSGSGAAVYGTRIVTRISAGYNDVWENDGGNYGNVEEGDGAISEDPLFVDEENDIFYLLEDSPCVDAGDPNNLNDFDGSRADMGCYSGLQAPEIELPVAEPDSIDFGEVDVGSERAVTITLTNPNEESEVTVSAFPSPLSPFSAGDLQVTLEGGEEHEFDIVFAPEEAQEYSEILVLVVSTMVELADTLTIPYPVGTIDLQLEGVGLPVFVDDSTLEPLEYDLLNCFPNPFNGSIEIIVSLQQSVDIKLEVFDQNGRYMEDIYQGNMSFGQTGFLWTPGNSPAGTYFIRLTHDGQSIQFPVKFLK